MWIGQIKFFSGKEVLCEVGADDYWVEERGGREESFEIAADEQLIGAKLYTGSRYNDVDCFQSVTWMKGKIPK